jgi:WD40 repeat protein
VDISGNYAIVGAYGEGDASGGGGYGGALSGKAYIFNVTTGALVHTLNNPNAYSTSDYDRFGSSVAISVDYAIVSTPFESDASADPINSGKAYIYNVTTGALLYTLNDPNAYGASAYDYFGQSVDVSGNYAIVGAYGDNAAGGSSSGKAYIFNATTGALVHTLNNPNAYGTSAGDYFGSIVAISGNYAIVGAYQEDDASFGAQQGKAYIFNATTGALVHTLDNPNAYGTVSSDNFGRSVAISGNYAIVNAYIEDDAGGLSSGKAYIFNVTTGALLYTLNNPNAYGTSAYDVFGYSVAISDNYAIVGAYLEDDLAGTDSGKAYIYNVTTGAQLFTLNNPNAYNTSYNDNFGYSVTISGNYAIVGANEDDAGGAGSGKAYIYTLAL